MPQHESKEAFPLEWPAGFNRTPQRDKKHSQFKCTIAQARDGVLHEIELMNGINPIISSNVPVKRDGQMYGNMKPVDGNTGIAVYFTWDNEQYVLACDQYIYLQDNLRAIEKSIEALRGLKRWGASDILKRAFQGFKALPESSLPFKMWYDILGVNPNSNYEAITSTYKLLIKKYHPDNPETGSRERFDEIQSAYSYYKDTL